MVLRNFVDSLYITAGVYLIGPIALAFGIDFFAATMYTAAGFLFTFLLVLAEVTYNRF
ncbi:MAG: hypothetical protein NUV67_03080 [archaeon]|nr:hypothetical protein [archaeon]